MDSCGSKGISTLMSRGRKETPIAIRFWKFVQKTPTCWIWTAVRNQQGYGRVYVHQTRRVESAHRVSWWLAGHEIPSGMWVLHRCDNPPCVNPDHLWLGTRLDNMRDMTRKRRHPLNEQNKARTHCRVGHIFTVANTYMDRGRRRCRACGAARMRRSRAS